jgi:hypothetical protein
MGKRENIMVFLLKHNLYFMHALSTRGDAFASFDKPRLSKGGRGVLTQTFIDEYSLQMSHTK